MHLYQIFLLLTILVKCAVESVEVGREVEGGVQLVSAGPIQLVVPDTLRFTIKNTDNCMGYFQICYVSDPTASRRQLMQKYVNVGASCPPGCCTLGMKPSSHGVFGLGAEARDGNLYGMFVDGSDSWCPRYVIDGISNFTVTHVPECAVVVDGATLPKEYIKPKDKAFNIKWIIAICVGLALLLLIAGIVGLYICTRPRKGAITRVKSTPRNANPPKSHCKTPPISEKLDRTPHTSVSRSPITPTSYKEQFGKTKSRVYQSSQKPNMKLINLSNSATSNEI